MMVDMEVERCSVVESEKLESSRKGGRLDLARTTPAKSWGDKTKNRLNVAAARLSLVLGTLLRLVLQTAAEGFKGQQQQLGIYSAQLKVHHSIVHR